MEILVGSLNPVKLNAVEEAFQNYFDNISVIGIETLSGVSDQPINDEIFIGAENRAMTLKKKNNSENLGGEFFVGIEGGIAYIYKRWFAFGGVCIIDSAGNKGFGSSAHFELPTEISDRLLAGEELGFVMDEIMNAENTKQKGGAISFFSNGVMNRKELYVSGIISALVPFHHRGMFFRT
ncbi:Inosine/xanthosine triphosphatase [hydrothermal vent metagenome]|uniref:inosine/xanthosine triphosphatase n=1 Tax=hydrothermal vent metagenome TaxID=652676 RepID=A0A3B1DGH8_9ZZZZ